MTVDTAPLGDIAEINPRLASMPIGPVSFLGMADVGEDGTTSVGVDRDFEEVRRGYTPFLDGDILLAKITPCFQNGKIAQAKLSRQHGMGSTEFHVVRGRQHVVDQRYLLHFLRRKEVRIDGERRMTGSGGQRRVPVDFLKTLEVPLPPLPEQRRIAAILDHADALRVKRRETISRLRELVQSAFVDCFGNPEPGWKVRPLADVVDPSTIVTYGIVQAGDEFQAGVPYIRTGDIVDGEIQTNKLRHTDPAIASKFSRSAVDAGDIVMSIRATVGTTAMVPPCLQGANLTQGTARIAPGRSVEGLYLLEYLRTSSTQQWIQRQVKGATFREITLSKLRELPVLVPDKATQRRFVDFASQVAATQTGAGSSNAELDSLFSSLQSRAFRGEL